MASAALLAAGIAVGWPALLGGAAPHASSPAWPVCVNAAAQHHAAVVVEHADGSRVRTACIGFDGATVTGKQALVASGIEYGFSSDPNYGDAVCQVDNDPASYPPNCFSLPDYWSIWQAGYGQAWTYASKGVDGVSLGDGDSVGFRYQPQPPGPLAAPPSPVGICPSPQPTSPPSSPAHSPISAPPNGTGSGSSVIAGPTAIALPGALPAGRPTGGPTAPGQAASPNSSQASPGPPRQAREPAAASPAHVSIPASLVAALLAAGAGVLAAAAGAVGLLAMLIIQVLLPRLRG